MWKAGNESSIGLTGQGEEARRTESDSIARPLFDYQMVFSLRYHKPLNLHYLFCFQGHVCDSYRGFRAIVLVCVCLFDFLIFNTKVRQL